jgi:aconitase B
MEVLESMLAMDASQRPAYHEIQHLLDDFWSRQEEEGGHPIQLQLESSVKGESLNIQPEEKKIIFTSQEDRGVFRNLATINSQLKESVKQEVNFKLKQPQKIC